MKRVICSYDDEELYDDETDFDELYQSDEFIGIESDVIDELGLYVDFSSVRGDSGTIWIFSDPNHENNADMWMGNLDEALAKLDYSEYIYGVIENVLTQPKDTWRENYKKYLQSLCS